MASYQHPHESSGSDGSGYDYNYDYDEHAGTQQGTGYAPLPDTTSTVKALGCTLFHPSLHHLHPRALITIPLTGLAIITHLHHLHSNRIIQDLGRLTAMRQLT